MRDGPIGLDHPKLFASLRNPLALISTSGGAFRVSAATTGFRQILGISGDCAGEPILPLLPAPWRSPVEAAVRVCMGPRRSKRLRTLTPDVTGRTQVQIEVYRPAADLDGHMILSLEDIDHNQWFADPRVATLFPQLKTDRAAIIYESDVKSRRARYRDRGILHQFGLTPSSLSFDEFQARVHPDDIPQLEAFRAARACLADAEVNALTARVRAATGEWRLISLRSRVLRRDSTGAPRRMLGVAVDITDHNAVTDALAETRHALVNAGEEERRNIGRELHDSTAQHLLGISFGLRNLERATPPTPATQTALSDIRGLLDVAGREIRMLSFLLHPPEISESGLIAALEKFCGGFGRRTGLTVRLETGAGLDEVSAQIQSAIYRVAQEAMMNVFRHANANSVLVTLRRRGGSLVFDVLDDGVGALSGPRQEGVGLQAMRTRMQQIGGSLTIDATPTGFRVTARAPLAISSRSFAAPQNARRDSQLWTEAPGLNARPGSDSG